MALNKCVCCFKKIFPWQEKSSNGAWHKSCYDAWDSGYEKARKFCRRENLLHGLPTPDELYGRRGSIGEMLPPSKWRNQLIDWKDTLLHNAMKHLYPTDEEYYNATEGRRR